MVLVTGGTADSSTVLSSAELYNPTTKSSATVPTMASARQYHTATLLPSGAVLIAGGASGATFYDTTELYDPAANAWVPSATMVARRAGQTATRLGTGMVLVAGGSATGSLSVPLATAERYTPAGVGGRNLGISTGSPVELTWDTGNVQTAYRVARLSGGMLTLLPPGPPLPAAATSYVDATALANGLHCYAALPLGGGGSLGLSDMLCVIANTRSGTAAVDYTLRLNQSTTASLSWTAPGGQTGYVLIAMPLTLGPWRVTSLPAGAASATDDTGGVPTCYTLLTLSGSTVTGTTDPLCGVPGVATLSSATASVRSLENAASSLRAAAARLARDGTQAGR
jgi:hypothetical protein